MEGLAVVTSLVVAALIVFIAYLYASRQSPPNLQKSVNWIVSTFQRGVNVIAGLLGQQPLFRLSLADLPKSVDAGVQDVERVLEAGEQAVASTVTPGMVPSIAKSEISGGLSSAIDTGLGYCYVGKAEGGGRVCAPVTRKSACMSREYYTNAQECTLAANRVVA
jgi:hypothetical protein